MPGKPCAPYRCAREDLARAEVLLPAPGRRRPRGTSTIGRDRRTVNREIAGNECKERIRTDLKNGLSPEQITGRAWRERIGDWEIDTVLLPRSSGGGLVVAVERSTRLMLIAKIDSLEADHLEMVLARLLRRVPVQRVRTSRRFRMSISKCSRVVPTPGHENVWDTRLLTKCITTYKATRSLPGEWALEG